MPNRIDLNARPLDTDALVGVGSGLQLGSAKRIAR